MRKMTMLALVVAMTLALAGCAKGSQTTTLPQTEANQTETVSTVDEGQDAIQNSSTEADASDESTSEEASNPGSDITDQTSEDSGSVTDPSSADTDWTPLIEGYDASNYPFIDGSTANHPLLAAIYERLCGVDRETAETMVTFNINSTGSIWEQMLSSKTLPYNYLPALYVVYEPPEDIKASYADDFSGYEIDPLGRDGLVFMVNKENPVESLTVEQLHDIYTGKITNWKEVGGNDEEIMPFQRNEDSGSQTLFMKLLMKQDQPMEPQRNLLVGGMGDLIDNVAAYDGSGSAIGFSVYYYANLMHANPSLKLIAVNGIEPSNESIESAEYPLTNDFYVTIRTAEPEDSPVRALRDWLLTDEGKELLEKENYVWARQGLPAQTHGTDNPFQ